MNAFTSRPIPARPFALPNLLTYGRIAAIPAVVACLYWQEIPQHGEWLRWLALTIFIATGFLLAGDAGDAIVPVVTPIGLSLLWLSALLTLYTGWDYFRAGVRHLIDE